MVLFVARQRRVAPPWKIIGDAQVLECARSVPAAGSPLFLSGHSGVLPEAREFFVAL